MSLEAYVRHGHRRVAGWLEPGAVPLVVALDRAQKRIGVAGHVGEIGIHHGQLFILLYLLARPDERAVAVDLFDLQELNVDGSGRGDEAIFRHNLEEHAGDSRRLAVLRGDSTALGAADLERAAGGKLRLVSVDGGHTAAITRHDLTTAALALTAGGIVILDDYFHPLFPGVSEGTNDFFHGAGKDAAPIAPFAIGANKLFFTTPDFAPRYLDALAEEKLGTSVQERELFGRRVLRFDFAALPWRLRLRESEAWKAVRATRLGRLGRALIRRGGRAG